MSHCSGRNEGPTQLASSNSCWSYYSLYREEPTDQVYAQSHRPKVHFAFEEMPSKIPLIASQGHKACWDILLSYIPEEKQKEEANRTKP